MLVDRVKLLAFIAATSMLLASFLLRGLRRKLGVVVERWQRESTQRWITALPTSPK